jgi:hypothetical protein
MKQSDRSQDLREYVNNHIRSNTILAVLGVTLDARVTGIPLHPKIQVQLEQQESPALPVPSVSGGRNASE